MLAVLIGALVGFACGAVLGIVDCKKTYGIPHNAKPEEGCWVAEVDPFGVDDYGIDNP